VKNHQKVQTRIGDGVLFKGEYVREENRRESRRGPFAVSHHG